MRIRRRELRIGAGVLCVCGVALAATLWGASDGQSRFDESDGGFSVMAKSPAGSPAEAQAPAQQAASPEQAPAELWMEPQAAQDIAPEDGSPAELWAEEAGSTDESPAELWQDDAAAQPSEPPFRSSGPNDGRSPEELWIEAAATGAAGWRPAPANLTAPSDYKSWIKARAEEFSGGVDMAGMPLYKFNLWLNAPTENAEKVVQVAYRFTAPSATHRALMSQDRASEFSVTFGASSCPKSVDVQLTFVDGRTERHQVDGCAILQ
jgi:hypothetical protein